MGKFRKAIATLAMVAVLSTLVVSVGAFAATYEDVSVDSWAYTYVEQLAEEGVLDTSHSNFRPGDHINRAEFGKMIVEKFEVEGEGLCSESFDDCTAGVWYDTYLGVAIAHNILRGDGEGKMRPADNINRAEAITVVHRVAGEPESPKMGSEFFTDAQTGWYDEALGWGYCYGVVSGLADGTYGVSGLLTREQAAKIIVEGAEPGELLAVCEPEDDDDDDDDEVVAGDLAVSFAANNPASGGNIIVEYEEAAEHLTLMGAYDFKANGGDVTVDEVTFTRRGFASDDEIVDLYLFVDGKLVSDTPSNVTTRKWEFSDTDLFSVSEGETAHVELKMDIHEDVSSGVVVSFDLTEVEMDGSVGGLPLVGSLLATVHVSELATAEIEFDTSANYATDRQIGAKGEDLAEFDIRATGDVLIKELRFEVVGTLSTSDLGNFELVNEDDENTVLASVSSLTDGKMLNFTGLNIEQDSTETYLIRGDINGGFERTFRFTMDKAVDFHMEDMEFDVRIKPTLVANSGITEIEAGDFEVERTSASPIGGVVKSSSEVVLAEYELTARNERTRVRHITLTLEEDAGVSGSAGKTVEDVRVLFNGSPTTTGQDIVIDEATITAGKKTFAVNRNIALGQTATVQVVGKVSDEDFESGDIFRVATAPDADNKDGVLYDLLDSGETRKELPLPSGNYLKVSEIDLDVKVSSSPRASLLAMGKTYEVARWTIKPENEDTRIRELAFTGASDLRDEADRINVKLYKGSELVGERTRTTSNNNHATEFWFGNREAKGNIPSQSTYLNWELEKDTTYTLVAEMEFKGYADGLGSESSYPAKLTLDQITHYPSVTRDNIEFDTAPLPLAGPTHELRRSLLEVEGTNESKTLISSIDQDVLEFSLSETSGNTDVEIAAFEIKTSGNLPVNGVGDLVIYDEGSNTGSVVAKLSNATPGSNAIFPVQKKAPENGVSDVTAQSGNVLTLQAGNTQLAVGDIVRLNGDDVDAFDAIVVGIDENEADPANVTLLNIDGSDLETLGANGSIAEGVFDPTDPGATGLPLAFFNAAHGLEVGDVFNPQGTADHVVVTSVIEGGYAQGAVSVLQLDGSLLANQAAAGGQGNTAGTATFLDEDTLFVPVAEDSPARFVLANSTEQYLVVGDLGSGAPDDKTITVRLTAVHWFDGAATVTSPINTSLLRTLPVMWTHSD